MENKQKIKIVFLGTPEFGAEILEGLIKSDYSPVLVITNPDRPAGRGKQIKESEVSIKAKQNDLKVLKPNKIIEVLGEIKEINPDLMIVAAYGQFLPNKILEIPKKQSLNIHPSLLPKYRGSSPIHYPILNGDKKTGVTVMLISSEVDKGDIVKQKEILIDEKETYTTLSRKLSDLGSKIIIDVIPEWMNDSIQATKQIDRDAVYSKILDRIDGKIDWKRDAEYIERQSRAFNFWPGCYCYFKDKNKNEKRIKFIEIDVKKDGNAGPFGPPGKTKIDENKDLIVQAGKDQLIVRKIQLEGGKIIEAKNYIKTNTELVNIILK